MPDELTEKALEILDWAQVTHTAEYEESPPADLTDLALLLARLICDVEALLLKNAATQVDPDAAAASAGQPRAL